MGNYYLYQIALCFCRMLPRRLRYAVAVFCADIHCALSAQDRDAVRYNLQVITGSSQINPSMVQAVFRNFAKYLADFFTQTQYVTDQFISEHVHLHSLKNLDDTLAHQRGCIIVSAHIGNWELAGAVMAKLGYSMSMVALPHRDKRVNDFFNHQREFFGARVIPTSTAVRRCLEHLKDKRIVAILADRDFTQQGGTLMNFLGSQAMMPKGAALFSIKSGAPIVPAFFYRGQGDSFEIEFLPAIYPPELKDKKMHIDEAMLKNYMAQYIIHIEAAVRSHPDQWLIFRRFDS